MKAWWSYEYYRNLNKKKCNAIYFDDTVHLWINQQIYTEILLVSVWLFVHFHFVIKLHYWATFSIVFFNRQFFAFLCLSIYSNISIYLSVSLWLSVRLFFCVYLSNIRLFIKKKYLDSFQLKIIWMLRFQRIFTEIKTYFLSFSIQI